MKHRERKNRFIRVGVAIVAATTLILFYMFVVCRVEVMPPKCVLKQLTGFDCPGCGSQRAFAALLEGDVWGAVSHNYMLPFGVVYLLLLVVGYLWQDEPRVGVIYRQITSATALLVFVAVELLWMVVRNIVGI